MRAALYETFRGPVDVCEVPDPEPPAGGIVLEVRATGVCLSDWHGWMGHDPDIRLPHVPGHEMAGVVAEVGRNVRRWRAGDRVTLPFVCGCGECEQCATGNQQVCERQSQPGFTRWGSYARYVAVDYADVNLVRLPDGLDDVTAASLGCRFATAWRAVVARGGVAEGYWLAVHGCGGVGLAAVMIGAALGARVVAVDVNRAALDMATRFGAAHALDARERPAAGEAVRELTGGGVHVSIDACGSAASAIESVLSLRTRGRHVQVGLLAGEDARPRLPLERVIAEELDIVGSHGMQAHRYPDMLGLIEEGRLRPNDLVARTVSLAEAAADLARGARRGAGVTVIDAFE